MAIIQASTVLSLAEKVRKGFTNLIVPRYKQGVCAADTEDCAVCHPLVDSADRRD